ncbi:MAG: GTP-binding protein, partial [Roseivirga sp.]|nr:GTP-binding protein [Roseivirga sp.]
AFVENKEHIESDWSKLFGDRKNELVIIGQNIDAEQITEELRECLCSVDEIDAWQKKEKFADPWPIHMN